MVEVACVECDRCEREQCVRDPMWQTEISPDRQRLLGEGLRLDETSGFEFCVCEVTQCCGERSFDDDPVDNRVRVRTCCRYEFAVECRPSVTVACEAQDLAGAEITWKRSSGCDSLAGRGQVPDRPASLPPRHGPY